MARLSRPKPFLELSQPGFRYRLEWFGGIRHNLRERTNRLLECFFTPYKIVPGEKPQRQFWDQRRIPIAIGYLPNLYLGQEYEKGNSLPTSQLATEELIEFKLSPGMIGHIKEATFRSLGFPSVNYRVREEFAEAMQAGLKKIDGHILSTSNPQTPDGRALRFATQPQKFTILIPEMELIRFYYCTSSPIAKFMFTGKLCRKNWFEPHFLFDDEGPSYHLESGLARLTCAKPILESDIPVLARVVFDGSQHALRGSQRIANSISAGIINSKNPQALTYPRTLFPFIGDTTLKISGIRIRTTNPDTGEVQYHFLAHRILDCSARFPFKKLSVGGAGAFKPKMKATGTGGQPTFVGHDPMDDRDIEETGGSVSNEPPSATGQKFEVELATRSFSGLDDIAIAREQYDLTGPEGPRGDTISQELQELLNGSTGDPTMGDSSAGEQTLHDNSYSPTEVPADLKTFAKALALVAQEEPSWTINTIDVGHAVRNAALEATISVFPKVATETDKTKGHAFSYANQSLTKPRRLICAEISHHDGRKVYLFDAEPRVVAGTPKHLSILLLRHATFDDIDAQFFKEFLIKSVIQGSWARLGKGQRMVRAHAYHSHDSRGSALIANRLRRLVQEQFL